ncbi:MAG TPA: hypothetical protein PKD83_04975 [Ignavibacteria bacterium]|nr:hypothetical protein [Ignavibacteria bacterium]
MIKSKAIDIIKKFSEDEKLGFQEFLLSPYFNKKVKLSELYSSILKNYSKLDDDNLTEEKIFAGLFKGKEFSYSFLRNLMSELYGLCEKFLIVNEIKSNSFSDINNVMTLLRQYNKRFLDKHFNVKLNKYLSEFKNSEYDDSYYFSLAKIYSENIAFDLYRSNMENVPMKLLDKSEFELCHIAQLLESNMNDITVNQKAFNLNFENELLPGFIDIIDIEKYLEFLENSSSHVKDELQIRFRSILLSKKHSDTENYFKLKDLILKNISKYKNAEKFNILIKLKNYCAVRIFESDVSFYNEKFSLTRIETEYLKYNTEGVGPLYANVYIENINFALKSGDIEFAGYYIENLTKELEESIRDSLYNLAMAQYEFTVGNFEKTLHHLSKTDTFNNLIKNTSKILYIRTYYELNLLETGFSALDSYYHFIKDNRDYTDKRKKMLISEFEFHNRIYKIKSSPEKFSEYNIRNLKKDIIDSGIYFSDWYLSKLDELYPKK